MSLTARHKKPGAFQKLVNSLEMTSPERRDKIMGPMAAEDPVFMERVKKSMLTFDELTALSDAVLMEVVHKLGNMQYLALALYKLERQDVVDKFLRCVPAKLMAEYKNYSEELAQVTKGQREGAQFKLVEAARAVEASMGIKIKPYIEA
jgi:flagellar motor switch protein FliG